MTRKPLSYEQIVTLLYEQPQRIAEYTAALTNAQLHTQPEADAWSLNQVLAHLRACADMWGDTIATIMAEDAPTIRAINPRTWIDSTDYPQQDFRTSFQAFTQQRSELVAALSALAPEAWARTATVTGAGKPLERTVHFYAQWLATHERSHVKHIKRIAEKIRRA